MMHREAEEFLACLEDAQRLLRDYPPAGISRADRILACSEAPHFELARFEQWSEYFEAQYPQKPTIRIVQHLACTGGTLIAKCLAAMPNVALLSEVHPLTRLHVGAKPRFSPTDLTYLALQSRFPNPLELSEKLFISQIEVVADHARQMGQYLVIREHSTSDYLVGESALSGSTVKSLLAEHYPTRAIVTVRHPVDSYLSLVSNGWVHFKPKTFEEYCRRYLKFLEDNRDVPWFRYEDVVENPDAELKRMCEALDLPVNPDFLDIFDLNRFSGDSGRSSDQIARRPRRDYDDVFLLELRESTACLQVCKRLDYEPYDR